MARIARSLPVIKGVLALAIALGLGSAARADFIVTSGSQSTSTYDYTYYNNYSGFFYPFNSSHVNSQTGTFSQTDSGSYSNSSITNVSGNATVSQTVSPSSVGISASTNASANPVGSGNYSYTNSYAYNSLSFTLTQDSQVTFNYSLSADSVTSGNAYSYGELYDYDTGFYYYFYAFSNGDSGPVDFSGSFTADLTAGHYILYGYSSYDYASAYNGSSAFASTFTALSLDISTVPEPGTLLVLGTGLVGLGLARRRLRSRAAA